LYTTYKINYLKCHIIVASGLRIRDKRLETAATKGRPLTEMTAIPRLSVPRIDVSVGLRRLACDAIKAAITRMDIYGQPTEIRLDERQLSADLGVSRTPIREALTVLEQEGFVRKTRREIVEMIMVWAAIESMAASLAAVRATPADLASLREMHAGFLVDPASHVDDYSQANMAFHKDIIRLGDCALMADMTNNIFVHMQPVRTMTMRQDNRAERSVRDHLAIIGALESRDAALAERLVREHTLNLAAHVERQLEGPGIPPGTEAPTTA